MRSRPARFPASDARNHVHPRDRKLRAKRCPPQQSREPPSKVDVQRKGGRQSSGSWTRRLLRLDQDAIRSRPAPTCAIPHRGEQAHFLVGAEEASLRLLLERGRDLLEAAIRTRPKRKSTSSSSQAAYMSGEAKPLSPRMRMDTNGHCVRRSAGPPARTRSRRRYSRAFAAWKPGTRLRRSVCGHLRRVRILYAEQRAAGGRASGWRSGPPTAFGYAAGAIRDQGEQRRGRRSAAAPCLRGKTSL